MLSVRSINLNLDFSTDRKSVKGGISYELYMVRQPRFGAVWFTGTLFMAVLVFVIYASLSGIAYLWVYATVAAVLAFLLFCLTAFLSIHQVYDRVFLLSNFGRALACQNCLLVFRKGKEPARAWFASGMTVFKEEDDISVLVSGRLFECHAADIVPKVEKRDRLVVSATRRRSFVQTDSVDLSDHTDSTFIVDRAMLLKKAGFKISHG